MKVEPYFLENEEWYYFDEEDFCYKLKKDAPEEAVKSYKEFYKEFYDEEQDGDEIIIA